MRKKKLRRKLRDSPTGTGKDVNAFTAVLAVKALALLQEGHNTAKGKDNSQEDKTKNETGNEIADNKTGDTTASGAGCPINITTLETQEFKGPLQPLENRVFQIKVVTLFHGD